MKDNPKGLVVVALIVGLSLALGGFFLGKFTGSLEDYQRGREIARRQLLLDIRDGIEAGETFYLSGMDIKFIPSKSGREALLGLKSNQFQYCGVCHARRG